MNADPLSSETPQASTNRKTPKPAEHAARATRSVRRASRRLGMAEYRPKPVRAKAKITR